MEDHKMLTVLAEGYSTQAKLSNKYWLFLMLASIISISNLPRYDPKQELDLPLFLIKLNYIDFISITLLTICVATIAFSSAFAQAQRTRKLVDRVIKNTKQPYVDNIHVQDVFDCIASPTFNRVAPISQFLQGKHQFFGDPKPKKIYRAVGLFSYIFLKLISMFIIFVILVMALYKNFMLFRSRPENTSWGLPLQFYWLICIVAFSVLVILIYSDIKYIIMVIKRIF
jgi:hypothetical protein